LTNRYTKKEMAIMWKLAPERIYMISCNIFTRTVLTRTISRKITFYILYFSIAKTHIERINLDTMY
jgi:hypothetical protein